MATGKITFIEPAIPPTYQSRFGLMHAYLVKFADGLEFQFSAKGNFKRNVGDEIEYKVTNETAKTASLITNFEPTNSDVQTNQKNGGMNLSILLQVCYKENMQAYAKDNKNCVLKETEADFYELIEIFERGKK